MGSSRGVSSQVVQYVPTETVSQEPVVTPAVAKSIASDTESAQRAQLNQRQRMYGIGSTYAEYAKKKQTAQQGSTLGGD